MYPDALYFMGSYFVLGNRAFPLRALILISANRTNLVHSVCHLFHLHSQHAVCYSRSGRRQRQQR